MFVNSFGFVGAAGGEEPGDLVKGQEVPQCFGATLTCWGDVAVPAGFLEGPWSLGRILVRH